MARAGDKFRRVLSCIERMEDRLNRLGALPSVVDIVESSPRPSRAAAVWDIIEGLLPEHDNFTVIGDLRDNIMDVAGAVDRHQLFAAMRDLMESGYIERVGKDGHHAVYRRVHKDAY